MQRRIRSLVLAVVVMGGVALAARQGKEPQAPEPELLPVLQPGGLRWWKGNLHTHSFWSDGDDFPEMIADWYKRHGYHFLALSDHNVLSEGERWIDVKSEKGDRTVALGKYRARFGREWVEEREHSGKQQVRLKPLAEFRSLLEEPGKYLLIPAEEITHRYAKAPVHMNAINLRDVIAPINGDSVAETIRVNLRAVSTQEEKTSRPILAFVNHPNFGWGLRAEDLVGAEEAQLFEIFNGHPSVRNYGDEVHAGTERVWDIVLALRLGKLNLPVVWGLATDDAHGYHVFGVGKVNPGRGWVVVQAPYLSAEAVVRALKEGRFYASTGVTLADVRRTGRELALAIQPEKGVTYRTQFIATLRDAPLDAEPRVDASKQPVTGAYSPEIGKVVSEVEGTEAKYTLTGKELYVRAKVISSKPHPNPYQKGDVEVAWTQPVRP
jgi:predicted metal-dependent phosphoesterase TrpH